MIVIGVTGGFGTGKSTVARMFERLGARVLDADKIARRLMRRGQPAWRKIVKTFGRGILRESGNICRRKLAARVFRQPGSRRKLEAIVHPGVMAEIRAAVRRLRQGRRTPAVVLDVPLLIEVGGHRLSDALVVVTAGTSVQRARLKKKYRMTEEEMDARIRAQMAVSAKAALADFVVDNSGSLAASETQVKKIWNQLLRKPQAQHGSR